MNISCDVNIFRSCFQVLSFSVRSPFDIVRVLRWQSHKICSSNTPFDPSLYLPPHSFSSYPPFSHSLCFFLGLFVLLSSSLSAIGWIPSGTCAAGRTVRIAVVISRDGRFVGARILYLNSVPRFSPSRLFVSSFTHGNETSRSPFREKTGNVSGRADVSSNDARRRDASGRHALSHNTEDRRRARTACLPYPSTCPEFPCKFMHVRRLVFSRSSTRTRAPKCDDYEFRAGIRRRSSVIYEGDNWSEGTVVGD